MVDRTRARSGAREAAAERQTLRTHNSARRVGGGRAGAAGRPAVPDEVLARHVGGQLGGYRPRQQVAVHAEELVLQRHVVEAADTHKGEVHASSCSANTAGARH